MKIPKYNYVPTLPPVGHVVLIWYHIRDVRAYWNGQEWRTPDNARLEGPITCWREQ